MIMLHKNNLTTVLLGTMALAWFSISTIKAAKAQDSTPGGTKPGLIYESLFDLRINQNTFSNSGVYRRKITNFRIFDNSTFQPVISSKRLYLDLRVTKYADSLNQLPLPELINSFDYYGFSNIQGPIYEYRFKVTTPPMFVLNPAYQPFPIANDLTLRWYIPSQFVYRNTFVVSFGTIPSASNPFLLNSLNGLRSILEDGFFNFDFIDFPSNISLTTSNLRAKVSLKTIFPTPPVGVPEANPSIGIMFLGLVGGLLLFKRK